jgi:hypothetical protein
MSTPTNQESECTICGLTFTSYKGMRLHCSRAHKEEYNNEMQDEARGARIKWTESEEYELATAEFELETNNPTEIINHLMSISSRSRDAIKKRRLMTSYKNKIAALQAQRNRVQQQQETQTLMAEQNITQIVQNTNYEHNEQHQDQPNQLLNEINSLDQEHLDQEEEQQHIDLQQYHQQQDQQQQEQQQQHQLQLDQIHPQDQHYQDHQQHQEQEQQLNLDQQQQHHPQDQQQNYSISGHQLHNNQQNQQQNQQPPTEHSQQILLNEQSQYPISTPSNQTQQINQHLISKIQSLQSNECDVDDNILIQEIMISHQDSLSEKLNAWCEKVKERYGRLNRNRRAEANNSNEIRQLNDPNVSNRRKRAIEYRLAQNEFRKNRKAYAERLLDKKGWSNVETQPDIDSIKETYQNIFSQCVNTGIESEPILDRLESKTTVSHPVEKEEIEMALKNMKSHTAGPDGITLKELNRIPMLKLELLFNIMLLCEEVPKAFKESRTTLIPKETINLERVGNWRPITISSIIIRLFHRIIAKRLEKIELSGNQRGFTKVDGCFANNISMQAIIKEHRKNIKPLCIVSLDLSKAFDTVSHKSIIRALKRVNLDQKTINYLINNYENTTTRVTCGQTTTGRIEFKRGVKQGDPISPIIFNILLDELITKLQEKIGIKWGERNLSCIAYADDIVLYAENMNDAKRLLKLCIEFFEKRGMFFNTNKSKTITLSTVPRKKKLYIDTENKISIDGQYIEPIGPEQMMKYLGNQFSPFGMTTANNYELFEQLKLIRASPLKPHQKIYIIKHHLIPRYISAYQRPNITKKTLKEADKKIRKTVKEILHLFSHCHNSIFYTSQKDGGLGMFNFEERIPNIIFNRLEKLKIHDDLLKTTIEMSENWINRIKRLCNNTAINKETYKKQQGQKLQESFSGNGINHVKFHKACSSYIDRPPIYWNGHHYIKAMHLRWNLLPCVGVPSNPQAARRCRAGCLKQETLSHILQNCPLVHWKRIHRHNYVVKRLTEASRKKGWQVQVEPHIRGSDGILYKPDILLIKQEELIVTDVGINWEGSIPLSVQFDNKKSRYSVDGFINSLLSRYPNKTISIIPVIVGARGGWCQQNISFVAKTNLSNKDIENIIHTTLRGGWSIHEEFMRTVWRRTNI